jgi:hypothetical protein
MVLQAAMPWYRTRSHGVQRKQKVSVFVKKMDKGYVMLKFDDKVTQGSRFGSERV